MIVWAIADRILPFIGLCTVVFWTVKLTLRLTRIGRRTFGDGR